MPKKHYEATDWGGGGAMKPMPVVKSKEEILKSKADKRYSRTVPFGWGRIYEAMEEYAQQQTATLRAELEENQKKVRELEMEVERWRTRWQNR